MANIQIPAHTDDDGLLVLFGQSKNEAFDLYSLDSTRVVFGDSRHEKSTLDLVCVAKDSRRGYPSTWYRYGGSYTKADGYWWTKWTGMATGSPDNYPSAGGKSYSYGPKITIRDEHGTHVGTENCEEFQFDSGCYLGFLHTSTDAGWKFLGWRITSGGSLTFASVTPPYESSGTGRVYTVSDDSYEGAVIFKTPSSLYTVLVEAIYESTAPVTKTVTLEPNGGTVSPTTIQCTTGETYGALPIPTRSGWRFIGWFDAQTGGNQIDGETQFTDTSPTTLYAHWEEVPVGTFILTFDDAGGTGGPGSVEVSEGSSYTIPSTPPTRKSYTFEHWISGIDKYYPGDTITPTENMAFVAVWSGGPYSPRPDSQKDFMVYSSGSDVLAYNQETGAIVYAV